MTVIVDVFETILIDFEKGLKKIKIKGRIKTTQTIAFLDQPEYWEEFWRPEWTCYHWDSCERLPANVDVKNSQGVEW